MNPAGSWSFASAGFGTTRGKSRPIGVANGGGSLATSTRCVRPGKSFFQSSAGSAPARAETRTQVPIATVAAARAWSRADIGSPYRTRRFGLLFARIVAHPQAGKRDRPGRSEAFGRLAGTIDAGRSRLPRKRSSMPVDPQPEPRPARGAGPAPAPGVGPPIAPMLAKLADALPPAGEYLYEPKWDGFRALVFRDAAGLYIQSRDLRPLDRYYPDLHAALIDGLPSGCVLDGEIVVEADGRLDFEALQMRLHPAAARVAKLARERPASFVAFDALAAGGRSLVDAPQAARREALSSMSESPRRSRCRCGAGSRASSRRCASTRWSAIRGRPKARPKAAARACRAGAAGGTRARISHGSR